MSDHYLTNYYNSIKDTLAVCGHLDLNGLKLKYDVKAGYLDE